MDTQGPIPYHGIVHPTSGRFWKFFDIRIVFESSPKLDTSKLDPFIEGFLLILKAQLLMFRYSAVQQSFNPEFDFLLTYAFQPLRYTFLLTSSFITSNALTNKRHHTALTNSRHFLNCPFTHPASYYSQQFQTLSLSPSPQNFPLSSNVGNKSKGVPVFEANTLCNNFKH